MSTIAPSAETSSDPPAPGEVRVPQQTAAEPAGGRSSWISLPGGLIASLACHAILILWAIGVFDGAKPLAAVPPQSIAVDLVSDDEAGQRPEPVKPTEPEKPLPQLDPLRPAEIPDQARRAAPPPAPNPAMVPDATQPSPDDTEQKTALAARLADALQLPLVLPGGEADTRVADAKAKLEQDIIANFKSHLNKCWTAPAPTPDARRLKVLIRVAFKRDGTFFKEPMLIQAVASAGGPALVKSAMHALQQCQPYAFLPPDKYKEWRVLDLAFSPQGVL